MQPKVSVLLPVYNGGPYLAEAVRSILGQTLCDIELICIDDGSIDNSPELLREFAADDARVRVIRRPHEGLIASLNEGLRLSQAPLVARMDADDVALPDRLVVQYARFERDPDLWVLGTAAERIEPQGTVKARLPVISGSAVVARELQHRCVVRHPSVMMRRDRILAIGAYRPAYTHAEDYDLWLRVSEQGKIDNLETVGILYRKHSESVSARHCLRQRVSDVLARATHSIRLAGWPDPTSTMSAEPDLWRDPLLDDLIPQHVRFFRMVDLAFKAPLCESDTRLALRLMTAQDRSIVRDNDRLWQKSLLHIINQRQRISQLERMAALKGLSVHPGRFLRNLISQVAQSRSLPTNLGTTALSANTTHSRKRWGRVENDRGDESHVTPLSNSEQGLTVREVQNAHAGADFLLPPAPVKVM